MARNSSPRTDAAARLARLAPFGYPARVHAAGAQVGRRASEPRARATRKGRLLRKAETFRDRPNVEIGIAQEVACKIAPNVILDPSEARSRAREVPMQASDMKTELIGDHFGGALSVVERVQDRSANFAAKRQLLFSEPLLDCGDVFPKR